MNTAPSTMEEVTTLALQLPPADRVRLIARLADSLFGQWVAGRDEPARSLLGMCADLSPAPSTEAIDEARREMWSGFPREDV